MNKHYDNKPLIIKICGIKNIKTVKFLINNPINYYGLNFYDKSPRYIELNNAISLISATKDSTLKPVGVFVNFSINKIQKYIDKLNLKIVQLHGKEDNSYIKKLKENNNVKIIKALGVSKVEDFKLLDNFNYTDYFLLDYKPIKKNDLPGGNAKSFDWKITENIKTSKNWFLAGGINKNNIKEAISLKNPYGIDISSGVEEKIGEKSNEKISELLKIINEHEKQL